MGRNQKKISRGVTFAATPSAPANPVNGDVYYDSTLGQLRGRIGGIWVNLGNSSGEEVGVVKPYTGFQAPVGYLFCNGTEVSRTTYASLFSTLSITQAGDFVTGNSNVTNLLDTTNMRAGMFISGVNIPPGTRINAVLSATSIQMTANATGTSTDDLVVLPYGVGDGSTTFNLPDLRGIIPAGTDDMGSTNAGRLSTIQLFGAARLGATGGAQTHTLSIAQMPTHQHLQSHRSVPYTGPVGGNGTGNYWPFNYGSVGAGVDNTMAQGGDVNSVLPYTANEGGGQAHNNIQPTTTFNYIIKF